jgi:prepilin signal peptidase PulO-like enzyme (type II secretory pathway)
MKMALPVLLAALLGAAFGSFLNVALSRLPRRESVVWPASHCEACGRGLAWWENIPVASFLLLRGRCRTCHSPIGVRHLVVEAATGVAAAVAAWSWERSARG